MLEARWGRRLGPGIAALAGVLAIATTTIGAPTVEGRPPPECAGHTAGGPASAGSPWFRLQPLVVDGARQGQRLDIGRGRSRSWTMALGSESFATGPAAGRVVVGTDDGRRSSVSMVDTTRGCQVPGLATSDEVIRTAVLTEDGSHLYEFRVRRADRADLGVWRRAAGATDGVRVVPPIEADDAFGRTWSTTVHRASDGERLIVASCGEVACRFRVFDPVDGSLATVADPTLGAVVGSVGDDLVVRGACRGLPCPVIRVEIATGRLTVVDLAAGSVALALDADGRASLIADDTEIGGGLRALSMDGHASTDLADLAPGDRVLTPGPEFGTELPRGWFATDGPLGLRARSVVDTTTRPFEEVRP